MSQFSVNWNDGSNNLLTFNAQAGDGDATITISSVTNEGLDRSRKIYVSAGSVTRQLTVNQTGKREVFNTTSGDFTTFDGLTFNVLK